MTVSEWADAYRVLGSRVAAEPGRFRTARTPYLREIQDALGDPRYREVVVVKPAQVGGSEAGRNWLGHIVDLAPGPAMVVFPSEDAAKENIEERVIPMFTDSPQLARHKTGRAWDLKRRQVFLDTCTIYVAWAGSHQALASRPIQYVVLDEVDKYPPYRGKEADPISLARVRTKSYGHRGKVFVLSTPTIPSGAVTRSYNACPDRRSFHVPCDACDETSELEWANVQWDGMEAEDADSLMSQRIEFDAGNRRAFYVQPCCGATFTDEQRWGYVRRGRWVQEAEVEGASSVAFRISGLSSPWTSFTELAKEYVTARLKGLAELQHFYNSLLGIPFWGAEGEQGQGAEVKAETIVHKAMQRLPEGVIPQWATAVVASADTGKDHFYYGVRAWGQGYRSRLIAWGKVFSFEELTEATLSKRFKHEDGGKGVRPAVLMIDSGGSHKDSSRTEEVYQFSRTDPRIMPLKGFGGANKPLKAVNTHNHTYTSPGTKQQILVTLSIVDIMHFKDLLSARINSDDESLWEVCEGVGQAYAMQMASERKALIERRVSPDGQVKEIWRWIERAAGAANHYWDVEVYNAAGAYVLDAGELKPPKRAAKVQKPRRQPPRDPHGRPYHVGLR